MTRVRAAVVGVCLALQSCAGMSNSLGNSANSSGNSANSSGNSANSSRNSGGSSGQSGNSSGQSGNSSAQSNASSQNSSASSAQSSDTSRNSATSVESSQATTAATSNAPSSSIVVGSALLLGVSGGILSTVLTGKHRREARLERERLKQLQQGPAPQPMPYKVEPIPLQPGVTQPPATPPPPPPPMPPPAVPAPPPKPKRTELIEEGPSLDAMVMARAWLLANQLQLSQDLALGAGPTIDDLAGITGIAPEHRERFGRVLQKNRARLVFSRDVTPQEAALVMSRVGDLLVADPVLRTAVQ